jgi:MFS family permease
VCGRLLQRAPARTIISGSAAFGAIGALAYVLAGGTGLLFAGTPVFGLAIGVATTAAYTAAGTVIPPSARGSGFGLLTTASLAGLAISPIVSGMLGAASIRGVFLLDAAALLAMAVGVTRLMLTVSDGTVAAPEAVEEL